MCLTPELSGVVRRNITLYMDNTKKIEENKKVTNETIQKQKITLFSFFPL